MPLSSRSAKSRLLQLFLIASLALASRAPFLARADRFFDADEAVEGLMARHVLLHGEHPSFLWGQRYKGVPEVYVAAALFSVAGPTVVALKSATLLAFAAFVCLQFLLVERLFSHGIAWLATVLVLLGPPAFVLWTLSANAEIVIAPLAGTVLCLALDRWRRTESRSALMVAAAAAGFGLWVQQYILYYMMAALLAVVVGLPQRRMVLSHFLAPARMPAWLRFATYVLGASAAIYALLGTAAFLTGGFDLPLGNQLVGVHHPQKLWSIAAALVVVWTVLRVLALLVVHRTWRPLGAVAAAAFLVGYAPALLARLLAGGSAPIARGDLHGLVSSLPTIVGQIVPIVMGLRSPFTEPLTVPTWLVIAPFVAVLISLASIKSTSTPLFHFVPAVAIVVFVLSGAYVDGQSYRYLVPAYGAFAVVMAHGVSRAFRWSRVAGISLMTALVIFLGLGQISWYRQLRPDTQSPALIACLDRANIAAAYADYWVSYKLTFLTGERIVVAPMNGVDRYPPYTKQVRAEPDAPTLAAVPGSPCASAFSPAP